jgi:hypothetical protein
MRISGAFPSDYLKASDLQGQRVLLKMSRIEMRDMGDEVKPVLYFEGKEKGLVLNKTNANTIATAYGDETDDWVGAEIVLFETTVEYQGQRRPGIRCLVPPRKPQRPVKEDPIDDNPF